MRQGISSLLAATVTMKSPISRSKAVPHISGLILVLTAAHLLLAIGVLVNWFVTGTWEGMAWFFSYPSPLFFITMNGFAFALSVLACKEFFPGQSLRLAWFLISAASGLRLLGSSLKHLLSSPLLLNPLGKMGSIWSDPSVQSLWREAGWAVEGPLCMVMLAGGLSIVLRLYKRLGLLSKLTALDHALLGLVAAYSVYVVWTVFQIQVRSHPTITLDTVLHWFGDPLLCLLLFEAIFIHRAIADMGWGLVAKCWGAFVVGIFLTSLGSMGQWAVNFGYLPWPHSAVTWYVWYFVSAAFALGPAYQLEAMCRARTHPQDRRAETEQRSQRGVTSPST